MKYTTFYFSTNLNILRLKLACSYFMFRFWELYNLIISLSSSFNPLINLDIKVSLRKGLFFNITDLSSECLLVLHDGALSLQLVNSSGTSGTVGSLISHIVLRI